MSGSEFYVGLISGTSADGIDAALVDFQPSQPRMLAHHSHPYQPDQKRTIRRLMLPGDNEIDQLGVLDHQLGRAFAHATQALLEKAGVSEEEVRAIGSHGQTLRHRPPGELAAAFTLQIGDPNIIAQQTGITTVADLRRRDMAAGGQGAPLAPAFHQAVFRSNAITRFVVNIGGIGNITHLPVNGVAIGFDTGPGNCLMDEWIQQHHQQNYDANGQWAASGKVDEHLLQALLRHSYFEKPAPKSTGREEFHLPWLLSVLDGLAEVSSANVQATLAELTAKTIADEILQLSGEQVVEIYICGGGAHNDYLMQRLTERLSPHKVATTSALEIGPDWVEAAAFAWMARQTLKRLPGNIASVTGAGADVILGGVYFA